MTKIETRQFGLDNEENATLFDLFEYNDDGSLKTITKTTLRNKNYREIIYPKKGNQVNGLDDLYLISIVSYDDTENILFVIF